MLDQFIKQFSQNIEQLSSQLPKLPIEKVQEQLQDVAKVTLNKMDLVTRDEFEVQQAMLLKYRERIVQLEAKMLELEQQVAIKNDTKND
ncbi:accessory factor UbiK family protein [Marinomonas agarivorans]|nr:accessory factor UbiK family protein [Marinomonas agarivorans]